MAKPATEDAIRQTDMALGSLRITTITVYPGDFKSRFKLNDGKKRRAHNREYNPKHARQMGPVFKQLCALTPVYLYRDEDCDPDGGWINDGQHRISFASDFARKPQTLSAIILTNDDLDRLGITNEDVVNLHDKTKIKSRSAFHEIGRARSPWTDALAQAGVEVFYRRSGRTTYLPLMDNILAGLWIADRETVGDPASDLRALRRWTTDADNLYYNIKPAKAERLAQYLAFWINHVAKPARAHRIDLFTRDAFAFALLVFLEGIDPKKLARELPPGSILGTLLDGGEVVNGLLLQGTNDADRISTMAERLIRACDNNTSLKWGYRVKDNPSQSFRNLLFSANYGLMRAPFIEINGKNGR